MYNITIIILASSVLATAENKLFLLLQKILLPVSGVSKSINYDWDNCNYENVQYALEILFFIKLQYYVNDVR